MTLFTLIASSGSRVFGLDGQTLISIGIQLFNTTVLVVALSFLLYRPVRNFMASRTERIKGQFDSAEADMAAAAEQKALYEKKLEEIEAERISILDAARKLAGEKSKQMLDEAKREASAVHERASAEIQRERERVNEEMRLQIIEVSSIMAGKFVSSVMDDVTADRLLTEAMAELEDTAWLS